jgi:hypothetical protein
MLYKLVRREIDASGMQGSPVELTDLLTLEEAHAELARLIEGRRAYATAEGWECIEANGSRCVISMEKC